MERTTNLLREGASRNFFGLNWRRFSSNLFCSSVHRRKAAYARARTLSKRNQTFPLLRMMKCVSLFFHFSIKRGTLCKDMCNIMVCDSRRAATLGSVRTFVRTFFARQLSPQKATLMSSRSSDLSWLFLPLATQTSTPIQPTTFPPTPPPPAVPSSTLPSTLPSTVESTLATSQATAQSTTQDTTQPITHATAAPTTQATTQAITQATTQAKTQTTMQASAQPMTRPTTQPTIQPTTLAATTPTSSTAASETKQLSTEAIIGLTVGSVAVTLLLLGSFLVYQRCRRKQREKKAPFPPESPTELEMGTSAPTPPPGYTSAANSSTGTGSIPSTKSADFVSVDRGKEDEEGDTTDL